MINLIVTVYDQVYVSNFSDTVYIRLNESDSHSRPSTLRVTLGVDGTMLRYEMVVMNNHRWSADGVVKTRLEPSLRALICCSSSFEPISHSPEVASEPSMRPHVVAHSMDQLVSSRVLIIPTRIRPIDSASIESWHRSLM